MLRYDSFELIPLRNRVETTITLPIQCEAPSNCCQQWTAGRSPRPAAEPPHVTRDARRHAACNRVERKSAARGVPLCPHARGASPPLRRPTLGGRKQGWLSTHDYV